MLCGVLILSGLVSSAAYNSTNLEALPAGTSTHTIVSSGITRTFIVNRASGLGDSTPAGLFLALHGFTQTASQMCSLSEASSMGSRFGFISVCPQGVQNSWNAGSCCGTAQLTNVNDVQFARDIVSYIQNRASVDASRVFAAGYSNGGMMSYRLVCQASDVFRAAAPACGTYFGNVVTGYTCTPGAPRQVAHFHDTLDPVVNYAVSLTAYQAYTTTVAGCPLTSRVAYTNFLYFGMTCYERRPCGRVAGGVGSMWCQTNGAAHTFPPNLLERSWKYFTSGSMGASVGAAAPLEPHAGAQLPPPAQMVNKYGDRLQNGTEP